MVDGGLIAAAEQAARDVLPEGAHLANGLILPRGADPFVGSEQPLVLVASRWARVACGGVFLGGSFVAMTELFGLAAAAERLAQDSSDRADWEEELASTARVLTSAVSIAVLELVELPAELTPTVVSRNASEAATRADVGQISDAVAFVIHTGALSVRMIVVVPGVLTARLSRDPFEAQATSDNEPDGSEPPVAPDGLRTVDDPLAWVPIDLAVELGRARVPMSAVVRAGEGELLELDCAFDDPVALVSEVATVALGELQVNDRKRLELVITSVSRPTPPTFVPPDTRPAIVPDAEPPEAPEVTR